MSQSTTGSTALLSGTVEAVVGEVKSLLPFVTMFAGSHLGGVGAVAAKAITNVSADAKTELTSLKAELDKGETGPVVSSVLELMPAVEALFGLPPYDEAKLFAALNAGVDAVTAAVTAL